MPIFLTKFFKVRQYHFYFIFQKSSVKNDHWNQWKNWSWKIYYRWISRIETQRRGKTTKFVNFADRIKVVVAALCNVSSEIQYSQEGKNIVDPILQKTYGQLQQIIGTTFRQSIDPDIWVKLALCSKYDVDFILISDVRFPNECEAILQRGGCLIRLEGDPADIRANSTRDLNHISETALDDFDNWTLKIENKATIEELYQQLDQFLRLF